MPVMPWQHAPVLFQHPLIARQEEMALYRVGRVPDTIIEAVKPRGVIVECVLAQPFGRARSGSGLGGSLNRRYQIGLDCSAVSRGRK